MNPRRLVLVGIAAVLALGAVIALGFLLFGKKTAALELNEIPIAPGQDFRVDGEVITYTTADAFYEYRTDKRRSPLTTTPLSAPISGYDIRADNMAVFSGSVLQIRGQEEVTLTGTIHQVRCGDSHVAVLRRNAQSGADSIVAFDSQGNMTADVIDYSDGKVVNFGFYTEGGNERLWVIAVAVQQGQPVFNVKMHNPDAGGMTIGYLPSFYTQAIEQVHFTADSIFVVGTQELVRYSIGNPRERYRVNIYGQRVLDMAISDAGVSFLLQPRQESFSQTVRVLTVSEAETSSESLVSLHIPSEVRAAFLQSGSLYVFTETEMFGYNYAGRSTVTLELPEAPERVRRIGADHMLFETLDASYLASVTA